MLNAFTAPEEDIKSETPTTVNLFQLLHAIRAKTSTRVNPLQLLNAIRAETHKGLMYVDLAMGSPNPHQEGIAETKGKSFYVKKEKCEFTQIKIKFLGHLVSKKHIRMDGSKWQQSKIGLPSQRHSMEFESRKLDAVEQRYSMHEKNMIVVIHYLETWKHYLMGTKFMGYQFIFVVVDKFSKNVVFTLAPHECPTEKATRLFFSNVVKYFGILKDIVSDTNSQFKQVLGGVVKMMGT
ncbi:hypothetical protein CK203_053896 [Vitis vinifera]|uniref:Reverse transcriptase RNase H-like domain-containing protein n=1 Tax=Vitis vinifera TaxID=29760 RepID=A0A438GSJ7_VITVI|nr:hypothetical protein CK203_053896 [Vitis vinifera]